MYAAYLLPRFVGIAINEVLDQQGKVFSSFTEGRQVNGKHVAPIKEIAPKRAGGHGSLQVPIGGGNHPHIGPNRSRSTDPLEFPLLQHAEQGILGVCGKIADFIEEDRASFGELETTQSPLERSGERAFLMSEQF